MGLFDKMIRKSTAEQQAELDRFLDKREREVAPCDDVVCDKDLHYIDDGNPRHQMDVYYPKSAAERLPVMINIHGGGLLLGCKRANRFYCEDMCRRGFVVFCPEYSLLPEVNVFDILRELAAAIDCAVSRAAEYGGDASKLYLTGDSAGAYLCVYLAAARRCEDLAKAGVTAPNCDFAAMGLISGMFYTTRFDKIGIFLPNYIYGRGWKRSPIREFTNPENRKLLRALPPSLIITGDGDYLRAYSHSFYTAAKSAGVECELLDIADVKVIHAFAAMLPESDAGRIANDRTGEFLRRY